MPRVVQAQVLVGVWECPRHRALELRVRRAAPHARQRGARGLVRAAWILKTIEPDHNWIVLKIINEKTRNILKLSPVMIAAAGTVLLLTAHCSTLVALSPRAIFCSERTHGNTNYSQIQHNTSLTLTLLAQMNTLLKLSSSSVTSRHCRALI